MSYINLDTFKLYNSEAFSLGDSLQSVVEKLQQAGLEVNVTKRIDLGELKDIDEVTVKDSEFTFYFGKGQFIGLINTNVYPFDDDSIGITIVDNYADRVNKEYNLAEFSEQFGKKFDLLENIVGRFLEDADRNKELDNHYLVENKYDYLLNFYSSLIINNDGNRYRLQITESYDDSDIITFIREDYAELGEIIIDDFNISKYLEYKALEL